jgi:hypothetical protein
MSRAKEVFPRAILGTYAIASSTLIYTVLDFSPYSLKYVRDDSLYTYANIFPQMTQISYFLSVKEMFLKISTHKEFRCGRTKFRGSMALVRLFHSTD